MPIRQTDKFLFNGKAYKVKVDLSKASQIHVPGKGGVLLNERMPAGEIWDIEYPVVLNAQFVLAKLKDGWLRVGTKYAPLHFSNVRILKKKKGFELSWELQPWSGYSKVQGPKLVTEEFSSSQEAIKEYKKWMEKTFGLENKEGNPDIPDWVRNTQLLLILDMWSATGEICHNYQDITNLVKDLKKLCVPADTLIYLLGWSWRFDGHFPNFQPAQELGGDKKFEEMVDSIHQAGFRIMAHMHILSLDRSLPEYLKFWKYQITDSQGVKHGWPGVNSWGATFPFPYMRPCAKPWQDHLCKKIISPTLRYKFDAVFLDQTLITINDPHCNMEKGFAQILRKLRKEISGVLIGGEGVHERIVKSVPSCGLHGGPWCGFEGVSYEKDSRILVDLFGDYAIFFAHGSIPPVVPARGLALYARDFFWYKKDAYKIAQKYYDFRKVIKTLRVNYRDYRIDEESKKVIESVKRKHKEALLLK